MWFVSGIATLLLMPVVSFALCALCVCTFRWHKVQD